MNAEEWVTRQQIRDFAHQLDATSFILRHLKFPPHKLRDTVDGLQGAAGGRPEFELSFLMLARRLRHTGNDETAETYAQRKVAALDKAQRAAGRLLFTIKRGGGIEHKRTRYVDHLTPAANWMMRRARESDLWAKHPARAIEAFVEEAIDLLPPAPEKAPEAEPIPLDDDLYIQRMINAGINDILKGCDRAAERGRDDVGVARRAAERLLRYAENRHKERAAGGGVQICTPPEGPVGDDRGTNLYPSAQQTDENPDLPAAALDYAARGIPVFPVGASKAPLTPRGFKDASCNPAAIREMKWRKAAGIGVPTGAASGWLALDSDPRHGGDASLCQLVEKHGTLPETLEAETGGLGHHIIFEYPELANVGNSRGGLPEGLDVRGEGGYIIVAPSLHASGRRYRWRNDLAPAPVPEWLLRLLTEEKPAPPPQATRASSHSERGLAIAAVIVEGERNEALFRIGCSLRGRGADADEIAAGLSDINERRCSPPLPAAEVQKIARSCANYAANRVATGG